MLALVRIRFMFRFVLCTGDLVQTSSDLHLLRLTIISLKLTLVFDPEASSGNEDGENGDDDEDKNGNQFGRTTTNVVAPQGNTLSAVTPKMSRLVGD